MNNIKLVPLFFGILFTVTSCGPMLNISILQKSSQKLSGLVDPFVGKVSHNSPSYLLPNAYASACSGPVVVKLFKIEGDGSVDDNNPIDVQLLGSDARYTFLVGNLSNTDLNVSYIVKAEGCNDEIYKRPVTNFDSNQDINAKTSVIAEVINANSLIPITLNEAPKKEIENLINSIHGTSMSSAFNSLQTEIDPITKFTEIFGLSPAIIQDARPEVSFTAPATNLNEMSVTSFRVNTFHSDPSYSFAYSWKLDGIVKSQTPIWNHIPSANESGLHQIDLYVGKNDGSGNIDLTKPYYTKTFEVIINNNIPASVPNISLNSATPSPVAQASVLIDIATGVSMDHCASFSHLAFTDSPIRPGAQQFNIACSVSGTQTETVTFSTGDGTKNLYLWSIDHEGLISATPKTVSLVLDTLAPEVFLSFSPILLKGNSSQLISLSASDVGTGLSRFELYYSTTGAAPYSLITNLPLNSSSYSWNIPAINSSNTLLKLVATDLTGQETIVYSPRFEIDSQAPLSAALTKSSPDISNSTIVNINTVCTTDYDKILYSENNTTPLINDSSWENCNSSKNFSVSSIDGTKHIYAFTKDLAGNISSSSTISMVLDRTAPAAPLASLHSPAISISTGVDFTLADCLDRPYIFVSESITTPSASDASWMSCSNAPGAITHILTGPAIQGNHNLYIFAKDAVGNISLPTTLWMIYDTTKPTLNLSTTLNALYRGGQNITLNFTASDDYGLASIRFEYAADGLNFELISTLSPNATTYNWNLPNENTNIAKIRIVASDNSQAVSNKETVTSTSFSIDSTPPTPPVLTRESLAISSSQVAIMTIGSCSEISDILLTETNAKPNENEVGWQECSSDIAHYNKIVSTQGLHSIYAWAKDQAGNVANTANSISMTLDSIAPLIVTGPSTPSFVRGGNAQVITWTVTDATTTTIKLEFFNGTQWSDIATELANSGSYNWASVPLLNVLNAKFRITAQDLAGNTSQASSSDVAIDSSPPEIDSLALNNGALVTTNNNVAVTLSAHDDLLKIKYFCLKYDDFIKPTINDACWKDVTAPSPGIIASKNINFSDYFYQIGFTKGLTTVYAWVKDEAENISNNSQSLNIDADEIDFNPGTPPRILNISVANSDSPGDPIDAQDLVIPLGESVYIKWKAHDDEGFATNPISLSYTINDLDFDPITNASTLINGINGDCTIDSRYTGCAIIPSLSNGYFKIRITAKDLLNTTVFQNTASLNETKVKIIAGNTEDGFNGSALSAIFTAYGVNGSASYLARNKLVMSEDGKFFYIDPTRGLLWIDPSDGILKNFMSTTGTSSGDNGHISSATLKAASAIALDFKNNLLIWDHNIIRKVNLSNMTISKLLGGGTLSDPLTTINASEIIVPLFDIRSSTFIPMPNGDIIFGTNSLHERKFRALDNKVELIKLQGEGFSKYPSDSWTTTAKGELAVSFNPVDSTFLFMMKAFKKVVVGDNYYLNAPIDINSGSESTPYQGIAPFDFPFGSSSTISGLDGNIYVVDRFRKALNKYEIHNNTLSPILGTTDAGFKPCDDYTLAVDCSVSLDTLFITKNGRIYFTDNGTLRTINDKKEVITLFGQSPSYGNNVLATDARFGNIHDFKMGKATPSNDKIIISDSSSRDFRELKIDGDIYNLTNSTAALRFESDSSTGDILAFHGGNALKRFVRSTQTWNLIVGGGTKHYYDAASIGSIGSQIRTFNSASNILGFINNKIYIQSSYFLSGTYYGCYIRTFDAFDSYKLNSFMGADTCLNNVFDPNFTLEQQIITGNNMTNIEYIQDPADNLYKYFFTRTSENKIFTALPGGKITLYTNLGTSLTGAFTHKVDTDGSLIFFYCGSNGSLYQHNKSTSITQKLNWLSPTLKCKTASKTFIYHKDRNSLIFTYTQNGLDGIAEYDLN